MKRLSVAPQVWTATTAVPFEQRAMQETVREFFDHVKNLKKVNLPKDAAGWLNQICFLRFGCPPV